MSLLASKAIQLSKPTLEIVEYPQRKILMSLFLGLLVVLLIWTYDYLKVFGHLISGTLCLFCLTMLIILAYLSTIDTLVISKQDSTLTFRRVGLFHREQKTFKLQLIRSFKLMKQVKGNKIGDIKVYHLQACLISGVDITLFRSFSKKKIREHVGPSADLVRLDHGIPEQEVQLSLFEVFE